MNSNILEQFKSIQTFIFDVDGVLATDHLLVTESGDLLRQMNSKDGFAMKVAIEKGYQIIIITGGNSNGVVKRLQKLGVAHIHYGVKDKLEKFNQLQQTLKLSLKNTLYMGDDIVDLSVMQLIGLPCCPNDAVPEIKHIAKYISPINGGYGCARDVIEKVLKLNNNWI